MSEETDMDIDENIVQCWLERDEKNARRRQLYRERRPHAR